MSLSNSEKIATLRDIQMYVRKIFNIYKDNDLSRGEKLYFEDDPPFSTRREVIDELVFDLKEAGEETEDLFVNTMKEFAAVMLKWEDMPEEYELETLFGDFLESITDGLGNEYMTLSFKSLDHGIESRIIDLNGS